jgi:zinc/manganese transport system substrate-binding protein
VRRSVAVITAVVVTTALTLTGCTAGDGRGDLPEVVVTTNIMGDVVRNVIGDEADVTVLMRPNADPHSFEISAREAALMTEADLVVSNGLGLEEGLQRHLDRAAEAGVEMFVAGDHVEALDYSVEEGGAPDPHFWTDPARMIDVVERLGPALAEIEGIDPDVVAERTAEYLSRLEELDDEMSSAFSGIPEPRRSLVTNHHVFGYLAERFEFRVIGAIIPGGTTLASPSAADLDDLADAIEEAEVRAIFAEYSQPDRLVQVLADEVGLDVQVVSLFTESLTGPGEGAETYVDMQRANTLRITTGLSS